jgi:hypothetical protein
VALTESIKIIKTTKEHIHSTKIEGFAQAKAIDDKIKKVLDKTVGFYQLQKISKILNGKNEFMDGCMQILVVVNYHFLSLHQ